MKQERLDLDVQNALFGVDRLPKRRQKPVRARDVPGKPQAMLWDHLKEVWASLDSESPEEPAP